MIEIYVVNDNYYVNELVKQKYSRTQMKEGNRFQGFLTLWILLVRQFNTNLKLTK